MDDSPHRESSLIVTMGSVYTDSSKERQCELKELKLSPRVLSVEQLTPQTVPESGTTLRDIRRSGTKCSKMSIPAP